MPKIGNAAPTSLWLAYQPRSLMRHLSSRGLRRPSSILHPPWPSSSYVGGHELSYAEVKAIASGNPAVLTLAEADAELQRLMIITKNHAGEQYLARRKLKELPE